jgi:Terminase RNaseH-like domain
MVLIGVDVGQKRDPTAVCVAEPEIRRINGREEIHFLVRHLERLPLGTPYPAVADRVAEVVATVRNRSRDTLRLYVDATGVGQPLIDLLASRGLTVVATYFTHGDQRTQVDSRTVRLGKAYLVSRLQMLLQSARVHLPRTAEAEALAAELMDYEIRVDENANDKYGAFKTGAHDDLVTALGLAVQLDREPQAWALPLWG